MDSKSTAIIRWLVLSLATVSLGAATLQHGGTNPRQWEWSALGISFAAALSLLPAPQWARTPREPFGFAVLVLLAAWMLFQVTPLGSEALARVAPLRWRAIEDVRAITGGGGTAWVAYSAAPPASLEQMLSVFPAMAALLAAREMGWWWRDRLWIPLTPVVLIAWMESVAGLIQFGFARAGEGSGAMATGTYVYHNHFSGLLELAFPITVMWAVWEWRRGQWQRQLTAASAFKTAALLAMAACMLLGIVASLSRMGFASTIVAACATALIVVASRKEAARGRGSQRWMGLAALVAVPMLVLILLPPKELIARFVELAEEPDLKQDARAQIWADTMKLIEASPWTGVGIGAYQHGLYSYKTAMPLNTVDFAHNDYLQFVAELGIVGAVLAGVLALWVLAKVVAIVVWVRGSPNWEFAAGLCCAFVTMAIHSLADFNFYLPANALVIAWLAGVAVSPGLKGR